jgi:flagellar hook assembly protein FlgD
VFDAAGRSVRALFDGRRAAGESRLAWDGRDGTGRRVRGGVYFIRVAAGEEAKSIRVVAAR